MKREWIIQWGLKWRTKVLQVWLFWVSLMKYILGFTLRKRKEVIGICSWITQTKYHSGSCSQTYDICLNNPYDTGSKSYGCAQVQYWVTSPPSIDDDYWVAEVLCSITFVIEWPSYTTHFCMWPVNSNQVSNYLAIN